MYRLVSAAFIFVIFWGFMKCDNRKCFSITRGNKTRRFEGGTIAHDSYRFQSTKYDTEVPPSAYILQTNGSSIKWRSTTGQKGAKLKYYLLRIGRLVDHFGSPLEKRETILLGPFKAKRGSVYTYDCIDVTRTSWVQYTIWPLAEMNRDKEMTVFNKNDYRIASTKWRAPDPAIKAARDRAKACVCESDVMVNKLFSFHEYFQTKVTVYNAMSSFLLKFYLNRIYDNGEKETVLKWIETTNPSQNTTTFQKRLPVPPGKYQLKVQKSCGNQKGLGCPEKEISRNHYRVSNTYDFNNQNFGKPAYIETTQSSYGDTITRSGSDVSMDPIPPKTDIAAILGVSGGIVGSIALIYVIYVICLSKKRKRFGITNTRSVLVQERLSKVNDSVAVIYVHDSPSHKERVDTLCRDLMNMGLNVSPIDEMRRREGMFRNWKTEGEQIFKTHGHFIYVLSPGLVNACKPPGQKLITTGNEVPEDYEKATSIGYTNIPRLILDCIKHYKALHGQTSLLTVYFNDHSKNSAEIKNGICNTFTADHISVVGIKPVLLSVNKGNKLLERDVFELIGMIRNQKTLGVRVLTNEV